MFHKLIRPSDTNDRRRNSRFRQMLDNCTAEPIVEDVIFKCADNVDAPGEEFEGSSVHRFNPSRINQGDRDAFCPEKTRCFLGKGEHISKAEKCDIAAMLD